MRSSVKLVPPSLVSGICAGIQRQALSKCLGVGLTVNKEKEVLGHLCAYCGCPRKPETEPKTGYGACSPEIDRFLKEQLSANIFERYVLTYQERELATIAALVSLGGIKPMLQEHLGSGLHIGLTLAQRQQLLALTEVGSRKTEADVGRIIIDKLLKTKNKSGEPKGR